MGAMSKRLLYTKYSGSTRYAAGSFAGACSTPYADRAAKYCSLQSHPHNSGNLEINSNPVRESDVL
jgi:hypothetical protein